MIDKALLAKIRKCLALARSANEHEAAAALAKARQLMDEHGLDEASLELAEIEEATARASRNVRPPLWQNILGTAVCRAMDVVQFLDAQGDICFVGRAPRPEIATYAFSVLFRQLKAARADYISTQLRRCKPGRKRQRADVFCEGWVSAVLRKIAEMAPPTTEDEAIDRYLAEQHPGLAKVSARSAKMTRAANDYFNGRARGAAVDLNVGLSGSSRPLAIAP